MSHTVPNQRRHCSKGEAGEGATAGSCYNCGMTTESRAIAMLIDGDNAQPSLIEHVLAEAAKYGIVTTRRLYGDWTMPQMSGWKETLNSHAIQAIQQFAYTTGKNATDSTLIIDAMDLLHSGTVQGFCIVSSDTDYTRLATRIREQGLFVMGIGRQQTPKSLVNACEVFVHAENLGPQKKPKAKEIDQVDTEETPAWIEMVTRAIEETAQEDGWSHLGVVGTYLGQIDPAFDPRTYGHKTLSQLIKSRSDLFELRQTEPRGGTTVFHVRLKT